MQLLFIGEKLRGKVEVIDFYLVLVRGKLLLV